MARRNTEDAMSMLYTADGALSNVSSVLTRVKELTVQAANGTNSTSELEYIEKEVSELLDFIGSTGTDTEFNKRTLLDGSSETDGLWIQTGANAGQGLYINFSEVSLDKLGLDKSDFDFSNMTSSEISGMIDKVGGASDFILSERATIGAKINRLEYTTNGIDSMVGNLSDAYSRIADTDMAKTMMEYTKEQIRMQVSMSMLTNLFDHEQQMVSMLLGSLN
jgi:flagellin